MVSTPGVGVHPDLEGYLAPSAHRPLPNLPLSPSARSGPLAKCLEGQHHVSPLPLQSPCTDLPRVTTGPDGRIKRLLRTLLRLLTIHGAWLGHPLPH